MVTVVAVRMMQVPIHQIIDVIAVRHCRMPTVRAMDVVCVVAFAFVRDAPVRVGVRDLDDVLVVVVVMGAVKVPVVQVPHMVPMLYSNVTAVRPVLMVVVFVNLVGHGFSLPTSCMNGCCRVGVVQHVPDKRLDMGVRQPVEHVPSVTPARDKVLFQENPQAL